MKQSRNLGARQCSAAQVRRAGDENLLTISGDLGKRAPQVKVFCLAIVYKVREDVCKILCTLVLSQLTT